MLLHNNINFKNFENFERFRSDFDRHQGSFNCVLKILKSTRTPSSVGELGEATL